MKSRTFWFTIALTILSVLISCKDAGVPVGSPDISGVYRYSGYDTGGVEVVSGTLTIRRTDSTLSGEKNLSGNSWESGQGSIEGRLVEPTAIELWLNPQHLGTVYLRGGIDDGTIHGERYFDTGGPPIPRWIGTFKAVRVVGS